MLLQTVTDSRRVADMPFLHPTKGALDESRRICGELRRSVAAAIRKRLREDE